MPGVYQKLYDTASGILPPFPNKASGPQRLQVFILENTEKWLQRNTVKTEKKEIPRWLLVSPCCTDEGRKSPLQILGENRLRIGQLGQIHKNVLG